MARERGEARDSPDLGGAQRRRSGHCGEQKARGGVWVCPGVHEREREPKEYRGGSGVALSSRHVAHRGRGAWVAAATAREARREGEDLSAALVGVD